MPLFLADVSVLLVTGVRRDATLGISSPCQLGDAEVREAMGKKLRGVFGSSMQEWRTRGEIASTEDGVGITAVIVLRGIHPSNVVGDHNYLRGVRPPNVAHPYYLGHDVRPA